MRSRYRNTCFHITLNTTEEATCFFSVTCLGYINPWPLTYALCSLTYDIFFFIREIKLWPVMLDILFVILLFLSWSGDEASWHWPLTRLFLWLTKAMKLFDIDLWPTILYMWPVFFCAICRSVSLLFTRRDEILWPVTCHASSLTFDLLSASRCFSRALPYGESI